jgi:hypothetical protein
MAVALLQETGIEPAGLAKPRRFLELSKPLIGQEPVWQRLNERIDLLARALTPGEGRS